MYHESPFSYCKEKGMWVEREPQCDSETGMGGKLCTFNTVHRTLDFSAETLFTKICEKPSRQLPEHPGQLETRVDPPPLVSRCLATVTLTSSGCHGDTSSLSVTR
ncbi:hypothetical protein AV530_017586 [Patagioenas fasciata monilis]|uniref:Uncharacterized protein n=1 Tax=Patagioenas fasciata monilis TaxID=372326 RepID=A0A1V4J8S7_PATFA|nr:hypothetical protein AV530_017586 [Patagioenas fasciata monilis]